ncbi:MAG: hypothetical protein Q8R67_11405 [Rhodoferax sp.]|nr:hypothetical protein [Rhodoferax sp.]MDP3652278.1 hypothetical protein [Rhodoferax sp.]
MKALQKMRVLAALALHCLWPHAATAAELESDTFVSTSIDAEKQRPTFTYSVMCDSADRSCRMTLDFSGEVIRRPLERSDRLLRQVEGTLKWVKEHAYPAKMDQEYRALEGLQATSCWDAGDPSGVAGLCRFEAASGALTWVVLWGDMCSASCYSGFVPLYAASQRLAPTAPKPSPAASR